MRILVVNWQDRLHPMAGGAEVHLHEIFGRLARWGHEVTLLASGWEGGAPRQTVDGIDVHRTGTRLTFAYEARRYFKKHLAGRFDVMVDDMNKFPLRVQRWSNRPTVMIVHHLFDRTAFQATAFPLAAIVWLCERNIGRLYRGVPTEAVSESTARDLELRGLSGNNIVVIPNGVNAHDVTESMRMPSPEPSLIFLGRLQPYKRVDVLLRALAYWKNFQGRLHIVGGGQADASLKALAKTLGVADRVVFHGRVSESEKQRLLAGAWVHVLASEKEGWGLSVLEAGIWGVPSVATNAPGLRDAVVHGRTGLLAPLNDPAAFADGIRSLVENTALREELGAGARAFALSHSWDRSARETERHLESIVAGRWQPRTRTGLRQRAPAGESPLARTAPQGTPYGGAEYRATIQGATGPIQLTVRIGAQDSDGRYVTVIWRGLPEGVAERMVLPRAGTARTEGGVLIWELFGWPNPADAWLRDQLAAAGAEVTSVRRSGAGE